MKQMLRYTWEQPQLTLIWEDGSETSHTGWVASFLVVFYMPMLMLELWSNRACLIDKDKKLEIVWPGNDK